MNKCIETKLKKIPDLNLSVLGIGFPNFLKIKEYPEKYDTRGRTQNLFFILDSAAAIYFPLNSRSYEMNFLL